nr:class I SAM-dependent methyltransferase [Acetobacter syzygii]
MLKRMTPKDYSVWWDHESSQFQSNKIYELLSEISPAEATLEVGCGTGWSTLSLAKNRAVLALDNNPDLISLAQARLQKSGVNVGIIQSDLFEPSTQLLDAIEAFAPKVVVGWLIGSHPDDNDKRTSPDLDALQKPKEYREKVEDRLVSMPLCASSVEWVHTAFRCHVPLALDESEIKLGQKKEYESYMFKDSGFSVTDVQILDWHQEASSSVYVRTPNPNFPAGQSKPVIVSILAHRVVTGDLKK